MYLYPWGGPTDTKFCNNNSDKVILVNNIDSGKFRKPLIWHPVIPEVKVMKKKSKVRQKVVLFMNGSIRFDEETKNYILVDRGLELIFNYLKKNYKKPIKLLFSAPFLKKEEYRVRFVELLDKWKIRNKVILRGEITSKNVAFQTVDVYCLVFKRKLISWLPYSLFEATANNCLFITSKNPITTYYFKENPQLMVRNSSEFEKRLDNILKGKLKMKKTRRFNRQGCIKEFGAIVNEARN